MNSLSPTIKIFVWILILTSIKTIIFSIITLLPISQEMGGGLIFHRFFVAELILQIAYLIVGIGILKNKLCPCYPMLVFLGIGIFLQILKHDISLAVFYFIIAILFLIERFLNKYIKNK